MTTLDQLYRQRYPRRDGESDEDYAARLEEAMGGHRPERPTPTDPDAVSAQKERLQRAGVKV